MRRCSRYVVIWLSKPRQVDDMRLQRVKVVRYITRMIIWAREKVYEVIREDEGVVVVESHGVDEGI